MSISPRNLWPEDIAVTDAVAPVSLLKEQASLLGERTKNLVEGRVTLGAAKSLALMLEGGFNYDFELVAPALNNYRYRLFSISHGVELYPVTISGTDDLNSDEFEVKNEEEFLIVLETIFSSEKTKRIISSLIAQSTS